MTKNFFFCKYTTKVNFWGGKRGSSALKLHGQVLLYINKYWKLLKTISLLKEWLFTPTKVATI